MNSNSLAAGTVLKGRSRSYEIVKTLGQGSFGITYLAKTKVQMSGELGSLSMDMSVAVKEFFMKKINGREGTTVTSGSDDSLFGDYRRKFVREAANLSRLKHPNIVKVLEAFEANGTSYYVMEYINGGSLDDLIARQHGLSEADVVKYVRQIASALVFMHDNKMLHLDLKPGNVMIHDGKAVLIDFGLSKQYDASGEPESSTTVGGGTPGYAPLEQAKHHDGNGFPVTMDVYALGATMFKMLTGERPPEASDILNDGFPFNAFNCSNPGLVGVVEKAMAPMRKQRFQTVREFMAALDGVCSPIHSVAEETEVGIGIGEEPVVTVIEEPAGAVRERSSVRNNAPVNMINGHEYVDLGLSVKWAMCNVGAEKPSDCGDYFAWGEISPKSEYTEENSLTYNKIMGDTPMDVPPVEAPPVRNKLMSFIFGKSKSRSEFKSKPQFNQRDIAGDSRYDAARANWGGSWRLPTKAEIDELLSKCKWEWRSREDHDGYLITGSNGKSIFLPAAGWRNRTLQGDVGKGGFYWCSTPDESCMEDAYGLNFDDGNFGRYWDYRSLGRTVRPVSE